MEGQFSRTAMLLGEQAIKKLSVSRVAVFGIGGVGSYVVEALARCGVGKLDLIDNDTVALSNINRQIIATHSAVGKDKVEVAKERVLEINPNAAVRTFKTFFMPENSDKFNFEDYDYVVDAIDTVTAKIELVLRATEANVPIISSMGTGNKLDPTAFEVTDIYKTSVCPLAKVMRYELKKRGIKNLKVVYSRETPITPVSNTQSEGRRQTPGSCAFVPSVAGLIIAGEVVKDLTIRNMN